MVAFALPARHNSYEYDENGNRVMAGYDIQANNQMFSDGTYDYTYDEEGNRETRTVIATGYVTRYLWDHRNRLVGVEEYDDNEANLLSTVTNTYDAFNRWVRREVDADGPGGSDPVDTFFAYDGLQLTLELTDNDGSEIDGDDLSHIYSWGPAIDQLMADFANGGDLNWALTDHLGTPRDWVQYDDIGEETVDTGHQVYDSFGQQAYTTGFSSFIGFAGRPFEITIGATYSLYRWYDVLTGKWMSEDPIGHSGRDANLGRYVANQPTRFVDPLGLYVIQIGWAADFTMAAWFYGIPLPIMGHIGVDYSYYISFPKFEIVGGPTVQIGPAFGIYMGSGPIVGFSTSQASVASDLNGWGYTGGFNLPWFGINNTIQDPDAGLLGPKLTTYSFSPLMGPVPLQFMMDAHAHPTYSWLINPVSTWQWLRATYKLLGLKGTASRVWAWIWRDNPHWPANWVWKCHGFSQWVTQWWTW